MRMTVVVAAAFLGLSACDEEIVCPAGQEVCGGRCAEVAVDPLNCGACGNPCGTGEACKAGACTDCAAACGAGQTCDRGVCRADVYVACLSTNDVRGVTSTLEPAGPARPVDQGPISLAWLGERLWVSHTLAPPTVVGFTPNVAGDQRFTLGGGQLNAVRASAGFLHVTDALASTLVVLDPARGVVDEISLAPSPGVASNPSDVAVLGGVAVVPLYGFSSAPAFGEGQEIALVDLVPSRTCTAQPCGTVIRRIGLDVPRTATAPGAYDPPGFPFPFRAAALGTKAYVTLANLEEECFPSFGCYFTKPAGNGRLAVVETAGTGAPLFVDLGADCTNPGALSLDGSTLWVSCGGTGTVVPVNTAASPPTVGAAVTLPEFFVPGAIAVCGGQIYVGDQYSGQVARLATSGGTVATTPVCSGGEFYDLPADIVCSAVSP